MEEEWRSVAGYEGLYEVSNTGKVRSIDRRDSRGRKTIGKYLSQNGSGKRYSTVTLCKSGVSKTKQVHQLVASAFIGEQKDGVQVNHIDGNKRNNSSSNLEYLTSAENNRHAWRIGIARSGCLKGDDHPNIKLTDAKVSEMREVYRSGLYTTRQVAKMFGIGRSQAWYILTGRRRTSIR